MDLFKIFGKIGVDNTEANAKLGETREQASRTANGMRDAFRNMGSSIRDNFNPQRIQDFGIQVQNVGTRISDVGSSLTRNITVPVLGAATAVGGLTTALGFKRLVGIDTARGQFQGLGMDADKVMEQVDRGVTDTSLSMAEGASMAVGILATGQVPLGELEDQIKRVANVSAAYNVDSEHAAYLLNSVLTKNKVTWGDLAQMQQNQIPIVSQLADHYGVTGEEIMKMAQDGEISIEDLNTVIDKNAGAAAEAYAGTWRGVTANILANLGRIGAKFLEPTFEILKDKAADLLEFLRSEDIAAIAEDMGNRMAAALGWVVDKVNDLIGWWQGLSTEQRNLALTIAGIVTAAGPLLVILGNMVTFAGVLITGFGRFWDVLNRVRAVFGLSAVSGGQLIGILARFLGPLGLAATAFMLLWNNSETFREGLMRIWDTIVTSVQPLFERLVNETFPRLQEAFSSIIERLQPIVEFLMNVFAAAFEFVFPLIVTLVEQAINNVVGVIEGLITFFNGVIDVVTGIFSGDWGQVWDGVKQIVSGAVQAVWNLIQLWFLGRLVGAVRSLGSGLLSLFRNSWTAITTAIRNAVQGIFNLIRNIFNSIRNFLSNLMSGVRSGISSAWNGIRSTISSVVNGIRNIITNVFNGIRNTINSILSGISSIVSAIWNAIRNTIASVMNGIRSTISNVWNGIRNTISTVVNGIRNIVSSGFNSVRSLATNAVNGMRTAVTNGFNNMMTRIRNIPNQIRNVFSNAANLLRNAGRNIINGLIGGITSMIGNVRDAASNVMSTIRNFLPFSPAKEGPFSGKGWTLYSGQSITESLGDGMEDKEGSLISTARKVMGDLKEELDPSLEADVQGTSGMMTHNVFPQKNKEKDKQTSKLDEMIEILSKLLDKDTTLEMDGKTLARALGDRMNETLGKTAVLNQRGAR